MYAAGVTVAIGGRTIVDRCDLTVGHGDWVTIVGPNGAGKTTLLRALAGLAPAYRAHRAARHPRAGHDGPRSAPGPWPSSPRCPACHPR